MPYNLLIHNVLFFAGGVLNIVLPLVVLFARRKHINNLVVTFVLMSLSVAVFQISQVFGTNAISADMSRKILMFNITVIPINIFMAHWFIALIGKTKQRRGVIGLIYATGIILFTIHVIFPETYLVDSVPKMYLPYYYEPGNLQWVTRLWFNAVGIYYFIELVLAYRKERDPVKRNRYAYVLIAVLYAFVLGSTAILLVYDVKFDPMWSSLFGIYPLLIAYAVVRYQLMDVRIILQRAVTYALIVSALIVVIIPSDVSDRYIKTYVSDFPGWITPFVSSLVAVYVGYFIWRRMRENDKMKYEFITIVAHKFRTPLTYAKWRIEGLLEKESDQNRAREIKDVYEANEKMIKLVNTLIDLSNDEKMIMYSLVRNDCCSIISESLEPLRSAFEEKGVSLTESCSNGIYIMADTERMKFALQIILENALNYTPRGGSVSINAGISGNEVSIIVEDNGIGISKGDLPLIFEKFYRSENAKLTYTEGFGLGLYLAKTIIVKHGGTIHAYSDGKNRGSKFIVLLPALEA